MTKYTNIALTLEGVVTFEPSGVITPERIKAFEEFRDCYYTAREPIEYCFEHMNKYFNVFADRSAQEVANLRKAQADFTASIEGKVGKLIPWCEPCTYQIMFVE